MVIRFVPNEIRELIRERCDIVDVVGSYIQLKNMGKSWKACCPFHQEKTPSFTVSPERQSFHCFGCGAGGDVFKFVMLYENVDFTTAAILLAERAQITIPEDARYKSAEDESPLMQRKDRFYEIHEQLCTFYQKQLEKNPDSTVAQYLSTRELDAETLQKFRIGAAPEAWDEGVNMLRKLGFSDEEIKLSGISSESERSQGRIYDRFRNRLIFPIWNEQGRVVAFSARKVVEEDTGGKYVNSPESPIFKKSKTLYAYPFARKAIQQHLEGVIICEGQLDVIAMHRADFMNTVAPQGTAFTVEQAQMLRRQTNRMCIALDSDQAGTDATLRSIDIALPLGFDVSVIRFPGGKDPDELYRKQGMESIHDAVHNAQDFSDFLIEHFQKQYDINTPSGRARIANSVLQYVSKIDNDITQAAYTESLATKIKIPIDAVRAELNLIRSKNAGTQHARNTQSIAPPSPLQQHTTAEPLTLEDKKMRTAEKELLRLVIEYAEAAQAVSENIPLDSFSNTIEAQALVRIVEKAAQGHWLQRIQVIQDMLIDAPDSTLSEYLVESKQDLPQQFIPKALAQTIFSFNESFMQKKVREILTQWRNEVPGSTAAEELKQTYQECQKKLTQLRLEMKEKNL